LRVRQLSDEEPALEAGSLAVDRALPGGTRVASVWRWSEVMMANRCAGTKLITVTGEDPGLVDRLRDPLSLALSERHRCYDVDVVSVGRVGEVVVSITGSRGRLPLFFKADELEPGYVSRVVTDTLARYGL
jgi:hypothetical protein